MELILNWLDLLWIPLALLFLHKWQYVKGILFILICVLALRLQVELMTEIKYPTGIMPLLDLPLLYRGYIAYGVFIAVFLLLSRFSREKDPYIYIAAGITVFIAAFCISSLVLVL